MEYASTLKATGTPEDDSRSFSKHSVTSEETCVLNLPSGPDAAKDFKFAISQGGILLLKTILAHAHVDARDNKGRTALSHAAENGQLEIVDVLLKNGASVSARQWSLSGWAEGIYPYHNSGATALWHATRSRHLEIVKLLLEYGANPQARTTAGITPLTVACRHGCTEIVKVLLSKRVDVNVRSYKDVRYLHPPSLLRMRHMLTFSSEKGWAPIHEAVCRGSVEILQLLLEHGALVELPTTQPDGKTPLHFCVANKRIKCMKILLQNGADPNSLMLEGVTPLHLAAAGGWIPGIELLMEQDVFIDARDALCLESALHKAVRNCQHSAIARLSELGASQEAKNVDGMTYKENWQQKLRRSGEFLHT